MSLTTVSARPDAVTTEGEIPNDRHAEALVTSPSSRSTSPGLAARALIGFVRIYQAARLGRPSSCRYLPTCSVYAIEALERHGAARGSWLAVRRLSHCHPFGGYGVDPVPE